MATALARIAALGNGGRTYYTLLSRPFGAFAAAHRPAALLSRQISVGVESVATQLESSGLLKTRGLIGGKWIDAYDGKTIEVYNPATGDVIANVPCMGERETNDAITSAFDAFKSWSKLTAAERSKCLRKWFDLMIAHKEELGQLITLEQGKPLKEAIGEVGYGASFVEFFAEEAKRIYGDIIPATLADRRLFVLKQPVGVAGVITPWNFPLAMITRKVGPALACGCTVVIKPSELTPLTALAAAELSLQAGIPPVIFYMSVIAVHLFL
ncbi:Succinate-semialdehyde dehydrogenase (NAD(+)) [Bertholletia excelsa]